MKGKERKWERKRPESQGKKIMRKKGKGKRIGMNNHQRKRHID